jgi:hypothetical protein
MCCREFQRAAMPIESGSIFCLAVALPVDSGFPILAGSRSPPIIVRLFPLRETGRSSCGTHLANANSTSWMTDTPSGEVLHHIPAPSIHANPLLSAHARRLLTLAPRVSCVRFSPNPIMPVIVSCGWDKVVKVSRAFTRPWTPASLLRMMRSLYLLLQRGETDPMRLSFHQDL